MRLIVYIDDILILAESRTLARDDVTSLIYLLENLGFEINKPKSILEPTQSIEFLGLSVNSVHQELNLPSGKVKKMRAETWHLLESNQITARKLSQLLGRLQAATRAVPLVPLFYCKLQRALRKALDDSQIESFPECLVSKCLIPECLIPKCLIPECLIPKCLIPECLIPKCLIPECLIPKCLTEC